MRDYDLKVYVVYFTVECPTPSLTFTGLSKTLNLDAVSIGAKNMT